MDIIHDRAVGIDISKRDAKVCLRLPAERTGQFTSSVSTWAATAAAILELRAFLERQHVSTVVMEATGDYWNTTTFWRTPCRFSWSMPRTPATSLDERLTSRTRHGWPNSGHAAYYGHPSCHLHGSGNSAI